MESWGTVAQPLFSLRSRLNGPTFAPPGTVFGPIPIAGKYAAPPGFVHTSYRLLVPSGLLRRFRHLWHLELRPRGRSRPS